jgi:hypothetical protein
VSEKEARKINSVTREIYDNSHCPALARPVECFADEIPKREEADGRDKLNEPVLAGKYQLLDDLHPKIAHSDRHFNDKSNCNPPLRARQITKEYEQRLCYAV